MNPDELREKREKLARQLDEQRSAPASAGRDERIGNLQRGIEKVDAEIARAGARVNEILARAADPKHRSEPEESHTPKGTNMKKDRSPGHEARDAARRTIDAAYERNDLPEADGFRLNDLIERDKFGLDSEYLAAVGDEAYRRAFAKQLAGQGAEATLTPDEAEAMQRVGRAMATRAMAAGEGAAGGFAVPLSLDPTIILQNDGAINPIRDLATVSTIVTTTWAGVASEGVEATFAGEAVATADGAPEFSQPEIKPERASIWAPFSVELGQDWPGLAAELGKLFADAKSVKEAEVFATGKGKESVPQGLLTGATELVETGTKEVVGSGDVYALQEALAPRWQPRATWLAANGTANHIHKMVAVGDTEEAALMSDDRSSILGKSFRECSTMSAKVTTKEEKVLVYGDVGAAYRIVDRIGLAVEPVQTVLKEGKPTGQRGLFAYFRVGAKVIGPGAVQVLEVAAE